MTERALGSKMTTRIEDARGFHDAMVAMRQRVAEDYIAMGEPEGFAMVITVCGDGRTVTGEVCRASDLALNAQPC